MDSAASDKMAGRNFFLNLRLMARLRRKGATGGKAAARLGIDRGDDFAFKDFALSGMMDIRRGNGGKQRLRIRMKRILKQLL